MRGRGRAAGSCKRGCNIDAADNKEEDENDQAEKELSAQLAMKEDSNEAHLLSMVEETKDVPFHCQKWLRALEIHRPEKAANPEAAALDITC